MVGDSPQPKTSLLRTRWVWFGAFALLVLSSAGIVQAKDVVSLEDRNVRIVEARSPDGGIVISAQLTSCTEATISLSLTLENAITSCEVPLVMDAAGRKSFGLVTVRADDKRRPWTCRMQYRWKPGRRGEVKASTFAYQLPYRGDTHEVIQADFGMFSHQEGSGDEMPSIGKCRSGRRSSPLARARWSACARTRMSAAMM